MVELKYPMKDNSEHQGELNKLVSKFQPSIALDRISHWMDVFFKFNQGHKSTRSKLLKHNWFCYQTEISTNLIFKSAKFANTYFDRILSKHHTIGLPIFIYIFKKLKHNNAQHLHEYNEKRQKSLLSLINNDV